VNGLSLFAGIGGLDLGLERAGVTVVGQVEIDPFCQRVLAKHWPDVPRHDDVRTAADWWLNGEDRPHVDVVFGGFPCHDISNAGHRVGIDGHRSRLWYAMADVIRDLRPRYVLLENVPVLLVRGVDRVLASLAAIGYDAEWDCVSAASVGAPHERDRWFAVAHQVGHADRDRRHLGSGPGRVFDRRPQPAHAAWWAVEPAVGRVAHGVPGRVDRCRGLGNAVVPQVAEHVGRLLVEFDRRAA
jgi:DNA (cytosine-5)-methyltransferase 1